MTENSLSWLGRTIDGCSIENQLADGAFSWIYQVREVDTQSTGNTEQSLESRWIFKVAKPEELVHQGGLDPFCTQALTITNDGTRLVTPNTNLLLSEQHAKLARRLDTGLVRVRNLNADSGRSYFKMEYLDGTNLRQFFQKELDGMSILTDLACQFAAMKNLQTFPYHGDLKPENIMVTMDGAKAIDAGYFGTLDCEGQSLEIAVTTPCYYPFLRPDDLFAFGLMLWEAVLKQHPLLTTDHAGANEAIDGTVHEWINTQLPATRLLLSALSHLQRPAHLQPQIAPALEHVLLKALRLQLNSANKIVVGPGFESFTECFETLSPMSRERQRA